MQSEYLKRIVSHAVELVSQARMLDASVMGDAYLAAQSSIEEIENCIAVIEYSLERLKRQLDDKRQSML